MSSDCPAEEKERIRKELRVFGLLTRTLLFAGYSLLFLPLLVGASPRLRELAESGIPALLSIACFVAGCFCAARLFHRHWAWTLLSLVACLGPAFVLLLQPTCRHCGRRGDVSQALRCISCDAPLA